MSVCRRQAVINAAPSVVWELVGDPRRHVEWWPRVVEVEGDRFDQGNSYAQVTRSGVGTVESTMTIDRLEDLREIRLHCVDTGTYARWLLTEARGDTFVDVEFGMDPRGLGNRIFDATVGRRYFRGWLAQSLAGLERAATGGETVAGTAVPAS
jgi:hypothetical protein